MEKDELKLLIIYLYFKLAVKIFRNLPNQIATVKEIEIMGITRQELHNMSDLLIGCKNRIFVSDDPKEIAYMYYSANHYLSTIYKENLDRAYAAQAQAEGKEQQFISPELNPDELPFG